MMSNKINDVLKQYNKPVPFNPRLVFSLLISLGLALFVEHRVFFDTYAINDDVRNQIYGMAKYLDPSYFANDYIAAYFTQPSMISPIVGLIYKSFSFFADPKLLTQYLPFILIMATTYFLFKASEIHAGSNYAFWVSFVFNLYIWTMKYMAGGLARAFFYLLFFMFFYFLAKRAWKSMVLCFALQALIYPTACFLSLITLIIELIRTRFFLKEKIKDITKALTGSFLVSAIILYFRYIYFKVPGFGPMTTLDQAVKMPEFYLDGRACVFVVPFSFYQNGISLELITNGFIKFWDCSYILILIIAALVLFYSISRKFFNVSKTTITSPSYLWSSAIASLSLFVIAYLNLFYLYLPHRYIAYTLPLVPIYLIGALLFKLESDCSKRPIITWIVAIVMILAIAPLWREDLIHLSKAERKLHQFLETTPKQSMIAAPLKLASNIPAFAYRSVIASSETNIPFHQTYYKEVKTRVDNLAQLYATTDINYIRDFVQQYSIDYVVIDTFLESLSETSPLRSIPETSQAYINKRYKVFNAAMI
ncbi:MAG: hypothetical protein O3C63_03840 [Cyanobacteria bacterium]|nr:hypothetical protein [Cyanobacteriota bacterium]MDA1020343.1 hypothetical protein [Cyanobacteriota bacterium]